ncbi:MAG: hypothetical protein JKY56_24680 [Kofleriaceae bacterium]|nr:hypothetical protein [Kofleriaceae bacterium]
MKYKIVVLASAVLLSGACGKDDTASESGAKVSSEPEAKSKTPKKEKSLGLGGLFGGEAVTLPEEIANVKFGESEGENQKTLGQDSNYKSSDTFKGLSYRMRSTADLTTSVDVSGSDKLEEAATKAWGTPAKDKDGFAYWFNPKNKLRAHMSKYGKGKTLVIDRYQPIEDVLGDSGFSFSFAKGKALLGASIEDVHAAWGDSLCRYDEQGQKLIDAFNEHVADSIARFPPSYANQIDLCWDSPRGTGSGIGNDKLSIGSNGRVSNYHMTIPADGSPEVVASAIAFLDKKLGEGAIVESSRGQEHHYFNAEEKLKVKATVTKDNGRVHVIYSQYLPLEELFGGDGPGLGVEPAGVFGSFDDIQKADPDHFAPSGVLARLIYPGTEFSQGLTEISLSKMSKAKKVSSYKVVLHYKGYPKQEARILEVLAKKFGPARESKRKASQGKYIDFGGKGQRKVEVWQVNEQFQITLAK